MSGPDAKVFFYGSFMDLGILKERGVRTFDVVVGRLPDWTLTFQPLANVVKQQGDEVFGIVATAELDAVNRAYEASSLKDYQAQMLHIDVEGSEIGRVQCYVAPPGGFIAPSSGYLQILIDAAVEHGLPLRYIDRLARRRSR